VGVLVISALVESLRKFESGIDLGGFALAAPTYSQELGLAVVMILILLFRPKGLMAGMELQWPPRIFTPRRFRGTKGDTK
jgi:branched-chain amino acid transport system permease protein